MQKKEKKATSSLCAGVILWQISLKEKVKYMILYDHLSQPNSNGGERKMSMMKGVRRRSEPIEDSETRTSPKGTFLLQSVDRRSPQ